jgi:1-acyl-sn-glycerol-3-phosphate acyltransferase
VKWGKKNRLGIPYYLLNPFTRVNYVAAEETMRGSWISRLFALAGALTVKRTWRSEGKEVRRGLDPSDTRNKPIVVPVVISGFWRAFNKKGLKFKKKGSVLSVTFKEPLQIDYDAPSEEILSQIMNAIEQSKKHMMQGAHHWRNIDK